MSEVSNQGVKSGVPSSPNQIAGMVIAAQSGYGKSVPMATPPTDVPLTAIMEGLMSAGDKAERLYVRLSSLANTLDELVKGPSSSEGAIPMPPPAMGGLANTDRLHKFLNMLDTELDRLTKRVIG